MSWFLVADASRARVFAASARGQRLVGIADFINPEGEPPRDPAGASVEHAADAFSRHLSDYLESARNELRYERVFLVAEPKFLGRLRDDLSPGVRSLVVGEIDKDLSWFEPRELERRLQQLL